LEAVIPGGIGTFSFEYRKAFTGISERQLELIINGVQVATTPVFGPTEPDPTIYTFTVNNINSEGNVTVKIKNVGTTTTNRQTVIDNIEWTGYTGGTPTVATPTFNPPGGIYYSPQNVEIATETPGATIYYTTDGTDPDEFSNEYVNPIPVSVTTTIKAKAYAAGYDPSAIATAVYNFPVEVANIATLRAGATDGTVYRLTGEAILTAKDGFNNRKFIEDATAAIMIFDNAGIIATEYNIGDGIENITGTLSLVNQMLRFIPTQDPGTASSVGNPVFPVTFSIDLLNSDDQAKLVKLEDVTFTAPGTFANGQNYTITDGINNLIFRTDFWNVDYIGEPIPALPQDITGVIIQFNTDLQIVARDLADFDPVFTIGWANLQWPPTGSITLYQDFDVYAQIWVGGITDQPGQGEAIQAWIGYSTDDTDPATWVNWVPAIYNSDAGNNDEYLGNIGAAITTTGTYYYASRFQLDNGDFVYGGFNGGFWDGITNVSGVLTVNEPSQFINWANMQWPPDGSIFTGDNFTVYAQVYAEGITPEPGTEKSISAWIGFNDENTDPAGWTNWVEADYNVAVGNNDEYMANIGTEITQAGTYYYASRFQLDATPYVYGGYSLSGGGFWDGIDNVSGVLTVNVTEPENHVTGFTANADSYSAITVTWTDSDATGYLIKGSAVSYAAIDEPVDGIPEADGGLVKNIAAGVGSHQFTGLTAETDYFFKIFPYNGTAGAINYKTDGIVPEATAQTGELPGYLAGDFGFTASSGNWGTTGNWRQWDGTGWNTTVSSQPTASDNVYILSGNTAIVETGGKNAAHLIVEAGAKLFSNNTSMGSPRYISVTGNITCDGMIGNGSGNDDVISFNMNGTVQAISGSGSFTGNRMRKNATGNSSLTIGMDIELRYNGLAFYNQQSASNAFSVTIQPGVHLHCAGNGALPAGAYQLKSDDNLTIYGQVTLTANLDNQAGAAGVIVKSDASGNGSLIQPNEAPATVEAYISPSRWHYVSSPIDNPNTGIFTGLYMQWWDELNGKWQWVLSADSTLATDMQGYSIWAVNPTTLHFAGTLNAGARSYNLTYSDVNPQQDPGFNFVGNPYPSALDWDGPGWTKTDVDDALYVWEGVQYATYINGFSVNGQTNEIPPHQGFFVHTSNVTGGSLGVNDDARIHTNQVNLKNGKNPAQKLRLHVAGNSFQDEMVVYVNAAATPAFDGQLDAFKLKGGANAPQLFSMASDGSELAINAIPTVNAGVTVPVGFEAGVSGIFELKMSDISGFEGTPVFMYDLQDKRVVNLKTIGTYKFAAAPNDNKHRFTLLFSNNDMPGYYSSLDGVLVYAKDKGIVVWSETELSGSIRVFDLSGREITSERMVSSTLVTLDVPANRGYYIVNLVTDSGVHNQKVFLR
jgi:hypothetical protein